MTLFIFYIVAAFFLIDAHGLLTKETGERGCSPARGAGGCTLRDERRPHTEDHGAAPSLAAVLPKHKSPSALPQPYDHACIK